MGEELSSNTSFQLDLIKDLPTTSKDEYDQAASDGEILEIA
jgi:hypothetical protein